MSLSRFAGLRQLHRQQVPSLVPQEPGTYKKDSLMFFMSPQKSIFIAGDKRLLRSPQRGRVGGLRRRRDVQEPVLLQVLGEPPEQLNHQKAEKAKRKVSTTFHQK